MKKFSALLFLSLLLLNSCSTIATGTPMPLPVQAATKSPTISPKPIISTTTPTTIPELQIFQSPLVTLNAMTEMTAPDNTTSVWAVGDDGFITQVSQDGYKLRIDSPVREHLYDVDFVSSEDGWIVGANALILHWNGDNWEVSKPASDSRWPYSYDLYSVAFTEPNDGWAAGCTGSEGGEYFLVYHWNGASWSEVSLSKDGNPWVCAHDIVAFSSSDVWMIGRGWNEGKQHGVTVHWDGKEWKFFSDLQSYSVYSLSALSPDNIWAITDNGIVLHWDGVAWQETGQLDSAKIILAETPDDVFAVGNKIWYWNGSTWTDLSSSSNFPADADIKSILAPYVAESGYHDLWMLDSSGTIYIVSHPRMKRF